jgi:hypothetical protein
MSSDLETSKTQSLVNRAKAIILTPTQEWDRIVAEPATIKSLFVDYAVILAAIGPICVAIRSLVFGYGALGYVYHPSPVKILAEAIVSYLFALGSVFVLGLIIEALAPNFGGVKDRVQAMKVAVYGSTASWLAEVFNLIPGLAILSVVGLYSLYLLYLGLPRLMKAPQEKALVYTVVVIVVAIVLAIVASVILLPFAH